MCSVVIIKYCHLRNSNCSINHSSKYTLLYTARKRIVQVLYSSFISMIHVIGYKSMGINQLMASLRHGKKDQFSDQSPIEPIILCHHRFTMSKLCSFMYSFLHQPWGFLDKSCVVSCIVFFFIEKSSRFITGLFIYVTTNEQSYVSIICFDFPKYKRWVG